MKIKVRVDVVLIKITEENREKAKKEFELALKYNQAAKNSTPVVTRITAISSFLFIYQKIYFSPPPPFFILPPF